MRHGAHPCPVHVWMCAKSVPPWPSVVGSHIYCVLIILICLIISLYMSISGAEVGKTVAIIGAGGIGFDVGTHSQKVSVLLNWLCELSINLTIEKSVDIQVCATRIARMVPLVAVGMCCSVMHGDKLSKNFITE